MTIGLKLFVLAFACWIANIVIASTWHFNPAFCWGGAIIAPVWKVYAEVIFLCSIGFFIFALLTGWHRVPVTIGAMVLISAAPQFAHILTGGGSCQ